MKKANCIFNKNIAIALLILQLGIFSCSEKDEKEQDATNKFKGIVSISGAFALYSLG